MSALIGEIPLPVANIRTVGNDWGGILSIGKPPPMTGETWMGEPTAAFDNASAVSPWALINSSTTEEEEEEEVVFGEVFSPEEEEEEGGGEAKAKNPGLPSSVSLAWMN